MTVYRPPDLLTINTRYRSSEYRAGLSRRVDLGNLNAAVANMNGSTSKLVAMGVLALFFRQIPTAAQSFFDASNRASNVLFDPSGIAFLDESPKSVSDTPGMIGATRCCVFADVPAYRALDFPQRWDARLNADSFVQPVGAADSKRGIHWIPAIAESLLFTGVMHTFNITTEAGTRDTLNGHWYRNYADSVSELRGWSDSDTFMAPYVGHPIEGSIFGFTLRQNDPKFQNVQWGDGRDYFVSVLRSMAWSAVWHTQWKIGPVSEASIGNVMLHASPGFITLVDTPTLGVLTMIAEDAADRYLIMGLENRTTNRAIIILARGFLNPGRTFAYIMAFQVPWRRDTRIGLFRGNDYEVRKELVKAYKDGTGEKPFIFVRRPTYASGVEFIHKYPKEAPIELSAYPYYETFLGGGNCVGGGGSGASRVSPTLQIVAEVNGCLVMHFPTSNQSGDSLFYGAGPRWTPRASQRFSPYAEFLFGGRKVTYEVDNDALRTQLLKEWKSGEGSLPHYPKRSDWSVETASNGVSVAAGGGMDVVFTRAFAWRVVNLQYTHTWMGDVNMIHPQNGIRFTTEAILRIGTW